MGFYPDKYKFFYYVLQTLVEIKPQRIMTGQWRETGIYKLHFYGH
jgi:hypothetical protein